MGDMLYTLATNPNYKSYLEIGTWNGRGSTKCVMDALLPRTEPCVLYSLETNQLLHENATRYWNLQLHIAAEEVKNRLKLIHGRIIDVEEIEPPLIPSYSQEWKWYEADLKSYETCKNVFASLPNKIDVLILDGGEFTTEIEYQKLKDRTRLVICDDTKAQKCAGVRTDLLEDKGFKMLIDNPDERNGFCIFERV